MPHSTAWRCLSISGSKAGGRADPSTAACAGWRPDRPCSGWLPCSHLGAGTGGFAFEVCASSARTRLASGQRRPATRGKMSAARTDQNHTGPPPPTSPRTVDPADDPSGPGEDPPTRRPRLRTARRSHQAANRPPTTTRWFRSSPPSRRRPRPSLMPPDPPRPPRTRTVLWLRSTHGAHDRPLWA
jgi:hypothetical protein